MNSATAPLVSIVINNFNYARFIAEAIESALRQSYPQCEVIVVDDGSTDDSRAVIERFGDSVVRVFQHNQGQGAAMNAGFARARGAMILFLDSDDVLEPEAVARSVGLFRADVDRVQFALQLIDEAGRPTGSQFPPRGARLPGGPLRDRVLRGPLPYTPPTSGNVFSRRVLEKILPMPADEWRLCADSYLLVVSALHGELAATDEPLGRYRLHGANNWGGSALSVERLLKLFDNERRKGAALRLAAGALGYHVGDGWELENPTYLNHRLYMLVHHPDRHPFASDSVLRLSSLGARLSWSSDLSRGRAAVKALFYGALPLLPAAARRALMHWKMVPDARPWSQRRSSAAEAR